jgi:PAB-dependent poly(A)-specific ribonuclease subunit 2
MHPLPSFRAGLEYSPSITALAFDPVSDQLWSGNQEGVVSAYQGHSYERGVSFPVCRSDYSIQSAGVHKIVAGDDVVRASTLHSGVGGWNKSGTNKWYFPNTTVSTFTPTTSPTTSTLVSLSSTEIALLNTTNPTVTAVRKSISPSMVTHLVNNTTHHGLAVAGCADGLVRTFDTRTTLLRAAATAPAHQGGFSCLATSGNYAYSTGWGIRSGRPHPDPFVKVYDLRGSCRSLTSLPFHGGPTFVAVHPTRPSMIYVVPGEGGFVQTVDISKPTEGGENIPVYPFLSIRTTLNSIQIVSSSFITAFAISPTGAYLALGDTAGHIHILTSISDDEERIPYNGFTGQEITHPDPPEPLPEIQWTETTLVSFR